jgi:Ribbon-helix-helix protein, copG family
MRTGRSTGLGKLTAEIRARVPEDTAEEITRLAARAGVPLGEYVRDVIIYHAHGYRGERTGDLGMARRRIGA